MDYHCSKCELKVVVYREDDEVKVIRACDCDGAIIAEVTLTAKGMTKMVQNV